jgi:hypothetical protein
MHYDSKTGYAPEKKMHYNSKTDYAPEKKIDYDSKTCFAPEKNCQPCSSIVCISIKYTKNISKNEIFSD